MTRRDVVSIALCVWLGLACVGYGTTISPLGTKVRRAYRTYVEELVR